jgi:glycosyltransferase involved in cell wall biosynthesis
MNEFQISVIVPCYNQAQYLNQCLQSVLDQTHQNWECIIVNDGSTDNTEQLALEWINKDIRFKYIKKINGGLSSARNEGIKKSQGQFIQFLDSDDTIENKKLEKSIKLFQENEKLDAVISNFKSFTNDKKTYPNPFKDFEKINFNFESILLRWDVTFAIPIHCFIIKKPSNLFFDESLRAKEDWVFWCGYFMRNPTVHFINESFANYRKHTTNMTSDSQHMKQNYLHATKIIYSLIPQEIKTVFFENELTKLLNTNNSLETNLKSVRNSLTYRIGNLIAIPVRPIRMLFRKKN